MTLELREVIDSQQNMSSKLGTIIDSLISTFFPHRWREEATNITNKFEQVTKDLNKKLADEKKKSHDLNIKYNKHKLQNAEVNYHDKD